jgi:hypothetical protein
VEGAEYKAFSGEPVSGGAVSETGTTAAGAENGAAKPSRAEPLRAAESLVPEPFKRPGRPKGLGKVPGSGRRAGTPNRRTAVAAEWMASFEPAAKRAMSQLLDQQNLDPAVRIKVLALWASYKWGLPVAKSEVSGKIESKPVTAGEAGQTVADAALAVALARKALP